MAVRSDEQKDRYRRQITVVGEDGQEKIGKTRLLIAGEGWAVLPLSLPQWRGLAQSELLILIASKSQT